MGVLRAWEVANYFLRNSSKLTHFPLWCMQPLIHYCIFSVRMQSQKWSTVVPADGFWSTGYTGCYSPISICCGSLFTPTPALVLAATSTRYWTPGNNPPITTDRMAASTLLLIWNRVSFPRHQIYKKCKVNNKRR